MKVLRTRRSLFTVLLASLAIVSCAPQDSVKGQLRLGLLLYADHTAINASRDGFLEYVRDHPKAYGPSPEIIVRNIGGDATKLAAYTDYFATERFDLVVALGTPCAKTLADRNHQNKAVFAAPPDAVAAGIVDDPDHPGKMTTGVTYRPPVGRTLEVMRALLPDARTIGVIHNPAEPNSRMTVAEFSKLAEAQGWVVVSRPVNDSSDVAMAVDSLIGDVDVLFAPNDNTVHSAFAAVVDRADQRRVPIVSVDRGSVVRGALAGIGGDYQEIGRIVGEMGADLVQGADPRTTPVREAAQATRVFLNRLVAQRLRIPIPESLSSGAEIIQ